MKPLRLLLPLAFTLAACSGGAATTSAPGATGPAPTTGGPAAGATDGVAPTLVPAATTTGGGGGGGISAWCLNTVDEVQTAIGVSGVTATGSETQGLGGGCLYTDPSGALVYSVSVVSNETVGATFDAAKQTPGVVEVPGIGNGAVLMSGAGPLVILTDKGLISLGPTTTALMSDPAGYRTAAEALGRAAVGRIP